MVPVSAAASFRRGALNFNTWLLFLQYAGCFGVELTMNNAAALYFKDEFGLTTESAAAIASIFGWMNLFARGLGGYCSDKCNARWGMRGRIFIQSFYLIGEGLLIFVFAQTGTLGLAIMVMVFFSLCVQAAEGTTFGIVPYIDPPAAGAISGVVGAGGNVGAVGFGLCFRQLEYEQAFNLMGAIVLASGAAGAFINIKGHAMLLCGSDDPAIVKARNMETDAPVAASGVLVVPEPSAPGKKAIADDDVSVGESAFAQSAAELSC
jgi:NNP family nitrate/nitrite transporter-like MFS transporter